MELILFRDKTFITKLLKNMFFKKEILLNVMQNVNSQNFS